ncbi:avidin-like [Bufo gargarizans]|uniref:avidin-like n=1 Tax=Bufo gargarizans TaxID=30331 RepID=UPI001CF51267|nr:avidin-like [Bufo gargarizans]
MSNSYYGYGLWMHGGNGENPTCAFLGGRGKLQGARCNLTGVWVNTLGSLLNITAEGFRLKGSLQSSVQLAPHSAGDHITGELLGLIGQGDEPTFTMSINWKVGSVTAWVGQCFQMSNCPVLQTMWLLRSKATVEDNWKATRIGEDVFSLRTCHVHHVV